MKTKSRFRWSWLAVGLASSGCFFAGCAHTAAGRDTGSSPALQGFLPLAVGNQWSYATTFQGQAQPDLTITIVKEEAGYFVDDRPTPSRLRFDGEGLRDGGQRYLLKTPIKEGQKWMSVADVRTVERYEIVGVGRKVSVPAGEYNGCVTVRMLVRMDEKRAMVNEMTFAPDVGIIQINASLKDGSRTIPQSQLVLKKVEIKSRKKSKQAS